MIPDSKLTSIALSFGSFFVSPPVSKSSLHLTGKMNNNIKHHIEEVFRLVSKKKKLELKAKYLVEWHRKYTLAVSCVLLFFIGAPMGAIVKKGGLGMPVIVTVMLKIIQMQMACVIVKNVIATHKELR